MANYRWEFEAGGQNSARGMVTVLTRLETITNALITAQRQLAGIQNTLSQGFAQIANSSARATQNITNSTTVVNNFGRAMSGAGAANKQFHSDFWQTLRNFNTFNSAINFSIDRLGSLKNAMTFVFRKTQEVGGGFEAAERQLGVFVGAGQSEQAKKQFQGIVKEAERIGAETSADSRSALQAAISASKAGMKREDIKGALGAIMDVSIGEGMDAGKVAEIGAITSAQFKSTGIGKDENGKTIAADAANSLKVLQAAASTSSTDIGALFESLKNSASGATMLRMPLNELAATLSVISQNGETGGRAGTRMMMALSRIASQTPAAQKALKELGISFKDMNGDTLPFTQVLDLLKGKLAGVAGNAKKMEQLKAIFGESFSTMAYLVEQGGDAIKKSMDDIKNSMDVGDALKKESMAGMAGAYQAFQGSLEQVYISLRKTLGVPIVTYWNTLAEMLNVVSSRFDDLGSRFDEIANAENPMQAWIDVMKSVGFSGIFDDLMAEFDPQIQQMKTMALAGWETLKALIQEGLKSIFTPDVVTSLKTQAIEIFKAIWEEVKAIPDIKGLTGAFDAGKDAVSRVQQTYDAGKTYLGYAVNPMEWGTGMYEAGKTALDYGKNEVAWMQQGEQQLAYLGKLETKKKQIEAIPLVSRTNEDTQRLQNINTQIATTEGELKKLAKEYEAAGKGELVTKNAAFNSVVTRTGGTAAAVVPTAPIQRMDYATRKAIENKALEIEGGTAYQQPTTIDALKAKGQTSKQAAYIIEQQQAQAKAAQDAADKQAARDKAAQAIEQAKQLEATKKMQEEQDRAAEKESLENAQKLLALEKERMENKKKMRETEAAIANAPIEAQMEGNKTENAFQKFLLEPINKFTEAMSGVIGKFMGIFEGLGNKRVEAGQKSGRLDEAGAKKESADVLEGSVERAQKMLKLAQTPGQKAEAMQTQAEKLLELSDLTGDQGKAKQADDLLKKAQDEQAKQETIDLKKVELDQKLAKDNVKLLESKKDGSASESVARLQQLFESYTELGDVQGAAKTKEALQTAQREAAGEQVTVLKMILEELKLGRKSNELAIKDEAKKTQENTSQSTQQLVSAMRENVGGFDPSLWQPA